MHDFLVFLFWDQVLPDEGRGLKVGVFPLSPGGFWLVTANQKACLVSRSGRVGLCTCAVVARFYRKVLLKYKYYDYIKK
jgi:hypothetical protein